MPIYEHDGTRELEVKPFEFNGTATVLFDKVYECNGTSNQLIFSAIPDPRYFGVQSAPASDSPATVEGTKHFPGGHMNMSGYNRFTCQCNSGIYIDYWTTPAGTVNHVINFFYLQFKDGTRLYLREGSGPITVDISGYSEDQKSDVALSTDTTWSITSVTNSRFQGSNTISDTQAYFVE